MIFCIKAILIVVGIISFFGVSPVAGIVVFLIAALIPGKKKNSGRRVSAGGPSPDYTSRIIYLEREISHLEADIRSIEFNNSWVVDTLSSNSLSSSVRKGIQQRDLPHMQRQLRQMKAELRQLKAARAKNLFNRLDNA